jgi:thermitase
MPTRVLLAAALALVSVPNAWAAPAPGVPRASAVMPLAAPRIAMAGTPAATAATGTSAATERVVVGYDRATETQAIVNAFLMGAEVTRKSKDAEFCVVRVPFGVDSTAFAHELSAMPGVEYAEPDGVVTALMTPTDPGFSKQWNMTKIGAPAAWDVSRGASVTVAVVDTGVDLDHPDLVDRLNTDADYNAITDTYSAQDDNGHGTHVAGIIAATMDNGGVVGVANGCTVLPVKVLDNKGNGWGSDVAEGIRWAADHGASVINLSFGSADNDAAIADAIRYAVGLDPTAPQMDCVVVAATGNKGTAGVMYPAKLDDVIGVAATTSFDTTGNANYPGSNYGPETDICAPGVEIYSTYNGGGYMTMSGSSMASPHVAGVAALLRAQHPAWTREAVTDQILATAYDLGAPGKDDYFGWGRLDAARAVGAAPPAVNDDDIPGVIAPQSPIVGTLDRTTDVNDVFQLDLVAGSRLSAVLTGGSGTSFDLYLYAPGATSIAATAPIAHSDNASYPDTITRFEVPVTGRYYLDVRALSGSGTYTLSYGVVGTGADAEIPGVALPASPTSGTLDAASDPDDVFSVSLTAGQSLAVTMTANAGTDFDAYLFGPGGTSIRTDTPVASAMRLTYPETFSYVAPLDGVYYLDLRAYSGSGHYDLAYSVASVVSDPSRRLPGVPFTTSPTHGTLSAATDTVDVYSILLNAGQTIDIDLSGPATADYDLYLLGPGSTSINTGWVDWSIGPSSEESITYAATSNGTRYIVCRAWSGEGAYTLTAQVSGNTYTVNSSAGAGGSISPWGEYEVAAGGSVTVTMTPNPHYQVADVLVDGVSVGARSVYRFSDVHANHTIAATFALDTFPITRTAGDDGDIVGPASVAYGADATYTIVPHAGHSIFEVFVDRASLGMTSTVTLHDVRAPHSIEATFSADSLPITVKNVPHGYISPSGTTLVEGGSDSPTYTITPDDGYTIGGLLVDGVPCGAVSSYRFTNVLVAHTLSAVFLRATGITIKSSRTILYHGTKVTYSGVIRPNVPNGTHLVVEIRKSGSSAWSALSTRNTYSSHHWSYTYHTHSRHPGTYYVRVRYPGSATYAGSVSSSKKMILR